MPQTSNDDLIGLLREKTEETDLRQYLKSSLGGFTKKSVLEYLSILKRQQQDTADIFNHNLQALFAEKEDLKANNMILQDKLTKLENEYENLLDSLNNDSGNADTSPQDLISLKKKVSVQENELNHMVDLNRELNKNIEALNYSIKSLSDELQQSKQETQIQKDLLSLEKSEVRKQRDNVIELTRRIEDNMDEIKYLKSLVTDQNISELQNKIASQMEQIATQAEIISNLNAEIALKEQTIETERYKNESYKSDINHLSKINKDLSLQMEKLAALNAVLSDKLDEEYKKTMALITEKSDILIDKLAAERALVGYSTKNSALEMQIQQFEKHELSIPAAETVQSAAET